MYTRSARLKLLDKLYYYDLLIINPKLVTTWIKVDRIPSSFEKFLTIVSNYQLKVGRLKSNFSDT